MFHSPEWKPAGSPGCAALGTGRRIQRARREKGLHKMGAMPFHNGAIEKKPLAVTRSPTLGQPQRVAPTSFYETGPLR